MLKTFCIAMTLAVVASPALADTPITLTVPLTITAVPATFNYVAVDCRMSTATVAHIKAIGLPGAYAEAVPNGGLTNGDPLGAKIYGVDLGVKSLELRKGTPVSPSVTYASTLPAYGTPKNPFPFALAICMLQGFQTTATSTITSPPATETKSIKSMTYIAIPAY